MRTRSAAGSALGVALGVLVVVALLSFGFVRRTNLVARGLAAPADALQAFELAEAGLSEAAAGLGAARTGNVGSAAEPAAFGGGFFWVEAHAREPGLIELESSARYGTGSATLAAVYRLAELDPAALGVFAEQDLALTRDVRVDGFDSERGSYDAARASGATGEALVGSNGALTLAAGSEVRGVIVAGPGAGVTLAPQASAGATFERPELVALPAVRVPALERRPALVHARPIPRVVPPGELGCAALEVRANAQLVLVGPLVLVTGALALDAGAELVLDARGGPIELFVDGALRMDPRSSVLTPGENPRAVRLAIGGDQDASLALAATARFHGVVYAPRARVHVASSFAVFGALVARELVLEPGCELHRDLALGAGPVGRGARRVSWRVVECGASAAAELRDPFRSSGFEPASLPIPAAAHREQVLDLRYVDTDGQPRAYAGPERAFDWSRVAEASFGKRDGRAFLAPGGREEGPALPPPRVPPAGPLAAPERGELAALARLRSSRAPEARAQGLERLAAIGGRDELKLALELGAPAEADEPLAPALRAALEHALAAITARTSGAGRTLVEFFPRSSPAVQAAIVAGLVRSGVADAGERLAALLGSSTSEADAWILCALGTIAGAGPSAELSLAERVRGFLGHPDHRLGILACRAVQALGDDEAVPDLIVLLGAEDASLRARAHAALVELVGCDLSSEAGPWLAWLDRALAWWDGRAEPCRVALVSGSAAEAVAALAEVAPQRLFARRVVALVELALARPEPALVKLACQALGALDTPGARAALARVVARSAREPANEPANEAGEQARAALERLEHQRSARERARFDAFSSRTSAP